MKILTLATISILAMGTACEAAAPTTTLAPNTKPSAIQGKKVLMTKPIGQPKTPPSHPKALAVAKAHTLSIHQRVHAHAQPPLAPCTAANGCIFQDNQGTISSPHVKYAGYYWYPDARTLSHGYYHPYSHGAYDGNQGIQRVIPNKMDARFHAQHSHMVRPYPSAPIMKPMTIYH